MSNFSRREFAALVTGIGVGSTFCGGGVEIGGTSVERNVALPMRDGIILRADVHRPSSKGTPLDGRFPVILERTPYGKDRPSRTETSLADGQSPRSRDEVAAAFAMSGFVVVYQDVRGRYESEGEFRKYIDDAQDGEDTCKWILEQPWCDGRIGVKGFSYAAHCAGALASQGAPGVAAMWIDSGAFANAFQGGIRQGGAYELKQVTWAFRNAKVSPEAIAHPAVRKSLDEIDIHDWFRRMPWTRGDSPLTPAPAYEDYMFELWERGNFDEYWKRPGLYAQGFYDRFPDVPTVLISSWFDPYPRTAVENYLGLKELNPSPVRLILGPWTHGNRSLSHAGDVDFGAAALWDGNISNDYWDLRDRFFRNSMLGADNQFGQEPRVRIFVMGGGSGRRDSEGRMEHGGYWREGDDWPLPGTRFVEHYLHGAGVLSTDLPATRDASQSFEYDPRHPVPSIGGTITSGAPVMVGGAFDQRESADFFGSNPPYRPLAQREDVLVFQTPLLEEDLEVVGSIRAVLWVSSDALDTDFTFKLVDVYPPNEDYPEGFAMNVTDGILRVRYRDSWESPTLMTPGNVYPIEIEAFPTANRFAKGHRIRVDISSSNFPHFDLNFNTGEPEGHATRVQVARNTVHFDAARPSHVLLPIAPL